MSKTPEYQKRAVLNYLSKFERINLTVTPETKSKIKEAAEANGKTITRYLLDLIERPTTQTPAPPVPVPAAPAPQPTPDYIPSYSHNQAQIWIKALQDGRSICPPLSPIRSKYDDFISDLITGRVPDTFKQPLEDA